MFAIGGEAFSELEAASSKMWFSLVPSNVLAIVTTSAPEHRIYPSDLWSSH